MSAYFTRSALVHWGYSPAPNVAGAYRPHAGAPLQYTTWDEVMQNRRKRQSERLRWKRNGTGTQWHAYKIWVAYYDMPLMGGWQAFIETYATRGGYNARTWIDRDCQGLKSDLLTLFPLLLPLGSESNMWDAWKPEFARRFERRKHDGRSLGVAYVWWDRRTAPREPEPIRWIGIRRAAGLNF